MTITEGSIKAGAVLSFVAWLISRDEPAGPFSNAHNPAAAARLVGEFCRMQGWEVNDRWMEHVKEWVPRAA